MLILEKFDAISVTNANGEYIYANQNWLDTFHTTLDAILGLHPWDILPDTRVREVLKNHQPIIGHTLESKETQGFISYYPIMRDGEFFGVLIWVFYTWMDTAIKFSQMVTRLTQELKNTTARLHALSTASYGIDSIIGDSPAMVTLREEVAAAARSNSTVLIEGETGVGKELVAHSIHDLSARCAAKIIRVNCSAIPTDSADVELFGSEENSGTDIKIGKFEQANTGTLLLDEVDQLPLSVQPKLLRVLQEHEIERVGGKSVIPLDIRIIAITNTPLEPLVSSGDFRADLFYRLNVLKIHIPPLRERREDIPALTRDLLARLNHQCNRNIYGVDDAVMEKFQEYDWPGNVRELKNALEGAMNRVTAGNVLEPRHFNSFFDPSKPHEPSAAAALPAPAISYTPLRAIKADTEYTAIKEALTKAQGNKSVAAKILGVSRNTLYKKLNKYPDL